MALTGIAQVMSAVFADFNRIFNSSRREQEGESSWWNSVGNLIGNMFIGDEERRKMMSLDDSVLLVFYESVHLNRNFISTLTHAATEFSTEINNFEQTEQTSIAAKIETDLNSSLDSNSLTALNNMRLLNPASISGPSSPNKLPTELMVQSDLDLMQQTPVNPPSNLLVIFLQSCSALLQETKMESTHDTIKIFMLIMVCISEDQYANSLLHDSNALYSVFLYQAVSFLFLYVIFITQITYVIIFKNIHKPL
jgi:hypothetical protein